MTILGQIGAKLGIEIGSLKTRMDNLENTTGAESDAFNELSYDPNGNVSTVTTYTDSTKANLINIKTLTYSSGLLTGIVVTDASGSVLLTQTLTYNPVTGDLDSVLKDYA